MSSQETKQPLISKERVVTGRIPELDFAKGLCIIGLILVHVFEFVLRGFESPLYLIFDEYLAQTVGASLFMFCMGMTAGISRHNNPKGQAIRGFLLLTVGQVLNIFRYGIISSAGAAIFGDASYLTLMALVISVDIMEFAGMAFLTMALLNHFKMKPWGIFLVSIVMSIAGSLLAGVGTGCYPVDQLLGFFWGTETQSYFPLFSWFIFVAAGNLYGYYYVRITNKKKWYAVVLPVGIVLSVLYYVAAIDGGVPFIRIFAEYTDFTWLNVFDAVGCLICVITVIGILWLFSLKFKWNGLCYISKNINKYYCVSYVLIFLFLSVCELELFDVYSDAAAIVVAAVIFILSTLIIVFYKKFLESKIAPWCRKHIVVLCIVIWAVSIVFCIIGYSSGTEYPNFLNDFLDM